MSSVYFLNEPINQKRRRFNIYDVLGYFKCYDKSSGGLKVS